jgi:hypothetical protein
MQGMKWRRGSLDLNTHDRLYIRTILEMKLSVAALHELRLQTNTNACESFNATLGANLPKRVTYFRNAPAKAHAAAHTKNNAVGSSLILKLEAAGAPITRGSRAARELKQIERKVKYDVNYRKRKEVQERERQAKSRHISGIMTAKTNKQCSDYNKRQLDSNSTLARPRRSTRKSSCDHAYSTASGSGLPRRPQPNRTYHQYRPQVSKLAGFCVIQTCTDYIICDICLCDCCDISPTHGNLFCLH